MRRALTQTHQIDNIYPIREGVPLFRLEATGEVLQETEEMMPRSVWGSKSALMKFHQQEAFEHFLEVVN